MFYDENVAEIMVMGVGSGGINAINHIKESGLTGTKFAAVDIDVTALRNAQADIKIELEGKYSKGRAPEINSDLGRETAEESREKIRELLEDVDMLFIIVGMGGTIGTGASPIIAGIAKELGILTIAIVTKPFSFEGKKRVSNSVIGIQNMKKSADSTIVIPIDRLFELPDKDVTAKTAFHEADITLMIIVKSILDLIFRAGLISLDFADFSEILGLEYLVLEKLKEQIEQKMQ